MLCPGSVRQQPGFMVLRRHGDRPPPCIKGIRNPARIGMRFAAAKITGENPPGVCPEIAPGYTFILRAELTLRFMADIMRI